MVYNNHANGLPEMMELHLLLENVDKLIRESMYCTRRIMVKSETR